MLLYDLETAPNVSYHWFGKYEQNIIEIIEEGYLLTFAYKWLGEKKVHAVSLYDCKMDRKELARRLWELFNIATDTIAHNGDQYDDKWARTEFIRHGFSPPSPYNKIDTLKIARKFKFNSNKLDDLGKNLYVGRKLKHGGFDLWKACMRGEKRAFNKMVDYNKQDVLLLEAVYLRLRGWEKSLKMGTGMQCTNCGSDHVNRRGIKTNRTFFYQEYQCQACGHWMQGEKTKHSSKALK